MPTGTATVNFGAFPGKDVATLVVAGQTGIASTSLIEVWMREAATAEHSADEHSMLKDYINFSAPPGLVVAGTSFTIQATCEDKSRMFGNVNVNWAWL